jgi:hypothetical protein
MQCIEDNSSMRNIRIFTSDSFNHINSDLEALINIIKHLR